jgi:hypothetical protein
MKCQQLATRIESLEPNADIRDVARLCLLLSNATNSLNDLEDDSEFLSLWRETGLKMQAATDQHAAMTAELEDLARSDPREFDPEQIWVLIRAIKVQSQILQMYLGQTLEV